MSQQDPRVQYEPQYPPQYAPQPAPPKKKRGKGCLVFTVGAAVIITIIVAASSNGSKNGDSKGTASSDTSASHSAAAPKSDDKPAQSPAQEFKAYVAKNGTATEKAAAKHVTKIQGADNKNDILDSADIYTDYSGGLMSGDAASGKLIASSFRDWEEARGKASKNGLVTIYNRAGEILSNGNY
jgi:hypothetical protein